MAAGATTLNVPDTVGYSTPQEMMDLISYLRENVPGIENTDISVHCLQILIAQLIAHGLQFLPQGVLAGVLAQNHGVLGNARGEEEIEEVALGGGPLDASFKAINRWPHQ
mgnify:CR=1 FL=1